MKSELSMPAVIGLIAAAVLLVVGLGWFFMGRNDDHVAKFAGAHGARPMRATGAGGAASKGAPSE